MQGHPRWTGHSRELWQKVIHWKREWQITLLYLPWEPHELYKRPKRYDTKRRVPRSGDVQCYWGRAEENYQYPNRFCIHYVSNSGRPCSDHRTGKGQSSFQFPRRVVLKNVLTIGQLHSFPMVVRSCLKSCMLGFRFMWTKNFQMFKLGLEKELDIKMSTFIGL